MTDKKDMLLELAAKAAGMDQDIDPWYAECPGDIWNPLIDDGDALRLAVRLGIFAEYDAASQLQAISEVPGDDPYAATRRAIVRGAAEIGRAMK